MAKYDENCECRSVAAEQKPETVFNLLGESYDFTKQALAMAVQVNANLFGKQLSEQTSEDPRCMRDAIALHVDDLKRLCEELHDILVGLGV